MEWGALGRVMSTLKWLSPGWHSISTFYFLGYKVYARRWAVLILFVFYSSSNAMQWIQYTIINNIITR